MHHNEHLCERVRKNVSCLSLCVLMCKCVYVRVFSCGHVLVCSRASLCMFTCYFMYVHVLVYVCSRVSVCVHVLVYVYSHVSVCVHVLVYVNSHVSLSVCVLTSLCMLVHM